ncbi:MAG: tetratricopeptide repeat protein, partial [Caldilineaceae bacterium]|nr:tetratricopeptide repeat protein [Caldilineaceae bacterium]
SATSLLQLLNSLRLAVPILAMGQRAALDADHYEPLTGLSAPLTNVLLKSHGVILSSTTQAQLHGYTAGNPRLLNLLIALYQSGEVLDELLNQLPQTPSIRFLLGRILQRLTEPEIGLLMALAVFHAPAPVDVWQRESDVAQALFILHERHLLQLDQQGGVALLPAYRDVLLMALPEEKRRRLHANAATIYERRGRYTLAAHHLSRSTEPEQAIWFWREFQEQEINRGQAYPALMLFQTMAKMPLSIQAREQVAIFCATLERVVGDATVADADLHNILIKTPLLQVEADELRGALANDRSNLTLAEQRFRRAIGTAEQLLEVRLAHTYKGLGWRYRNERDLEQAWHYGLLAQYEVANFQGEVQLRRCAYDESITYLQEALALAEQVGHSSGIAKTCNNLGQIYARIGQIVEAERYFDRAEAIYRAIGKVTVLDGMTINRAFVWNLAGRFDAAVDLLQHFLADKVKKQEALSPELTALVYQNLAEAQLGLGALIEAEAAVQQAIEQEEIHVLPDALRTHGEIKLKQGFPQEAERSIRHALDLLEQNETPDLYLAGYAWRALAQVFARQNKPTQVEESLAKAIDCFVAVNLPNEVRRTHAAGFTADAPNG